MTSLADEHKDGILVLNAGSSSIKFALFSVPSLDQLLSGQVDGIGGQASFRAKSAPFDLDERESWTGSDGPRNHEEALDHLLAWLHRCMAGLEIVAVGHRVVHGGTHFAAPTIIDAAVMAELETLFALAPLHEPHHLSGMRAAIHALGTVPQVACFDTAFHRGRAFVEDGYAIPRSFYDEGVRRYGFHGLSYEYITRRLGEIEPASANSRVIVAHLGNGASLCALHHGRSIASTMGFSPLDGLAMGTRCGQIDPGVLLYLMQYKGMSAQQISDLLYRESGLKALSGGLSNDMRTLEASDDPKAAEAITYFVNRIQRDIGAFAAALGGLDMLVFTGGIGENSVNIRARVAEGLAWLGMQLDPARNQAGETLFSTPDSKIRLLRIPTNEEIMIAGHTFAIALGGAGSTSL